MKNQINLLVEKQKIKTQIRKFFLISITFFVAVLSFSMIVLLYNFSLGNQIDNLTEKEIQINQRLNVLSEKRAKSARLQDRIESIGQALNTRNNLDKKILSILAFMPDDVLIKEFDFSGDSISITLTSSYLYDFDYITEKINKSNTIKEIAEVSMGSMKYEEQDGNYALKLNFSF